MNKTITTNNKSTNIKKHFKRVVKTLLFKNNLSNDTTDTCIMKITIKVIKSNGYLCYDITFNCSGNRYNNPLNVFDDDIDGVILAKNEMTDKMVEYLLKEPSQLVDLIGESTVQCYKAHIIQTLARLWD